MPGAPVFFVERFLLQEDKKKKRGKKKDNLLNFSTFVCKGWDGMWRSEKRKAREELRGEHNRINQQVTEMLSCPLSPRPDWRSRRRYVHLPRFDLQPGTVRTATSLKHDGGGESDTSERTRQTCAHSHAVANAPTRKTSVQRQRPGARLKWQERR